MRSAWNVVAVLVLALGLPGAGQAAGLLALPGQEQAKVDPPPPCKVDPAWGKPDAPEPDATKPRTTNCDFHQWAVQEFFYVVQTGPDGLTRFLKMASPHALFLYTGDKPAPYPGSAATRFKLGAGMGRLRSGKGGARSNDAPRVVFLPRTLKTPNTTFDADTQAGSNAVLVDQKGQVVYYTAQVNEDYYDFVVEKGYYTLQGFLAAPPGTALPVGTVEIKSSWRVAVKGGQTYIPNAAKSYYTVEGDLCKDSACKSLVPATMALVGIHVVGSVQGHPEMIWATFEHKDNTPACVGTPTSSHDYSFYKNGTKCGTAPFWESCNQIPKDATTPSNICRVHLYGEPSASTENAPNIRSLDDTFDRALPAGSVWRNYFYANAVWTTGLTNPQGLIALDDASIKGSKKAANTSLESFTQEKNCLHCHTYQPLQIGKCFPRVDDPNGWKNLYVSHLFGLLCPSTTKK